MAPKRSSRSTPSKGTPKPPAPPTAGIRKSTRARGGSSEPRQLRSNSAEPQMQIGELKDPEQIIRENKRKNKQSSRASSRASTQEPDELVVDRGAEQSLEPSLEPVPEAINEPSHSSPVAADEVEGIERATPSEVSREQSSDREDQAPISLVRHSSVEFSVESDSVAPTIEEHVENTPYGYNQHSLSLIVEEPTEESILARYAQSARNLHQTPASTTHYTQYAQETYESGTFAETAREPSFSSDAASPQPRASTSRASVRQETIDLTSDDEDGEPVQTPIAARSEPIDLISDSEDEDEVRPAPPAQDETVLQSVIEEDNYRLPTQAQEETQLDTIIEGGDYTLPPQADEDTHLESAIELSSGSDEDDEMDEDDGKDDYDMNHDVEDDYSEAANEDEYEGQYEDHYQGKRQMSRSQEPILEEDTTLTQAHKYLDEHEREYRQHQNQSGGHDTQVSTPRGNKSSKGMLAIFHKSSPEGQGVPAHGATATPSGPRKDWRRHFDPEEGDDTLTLALKAEFRDEPSAPSTPAQQMTAAYNPALEFTFSRRPDDTTFTASYKDALHELEAEEKEKALKAQQGAMGPPLTPASASRRLSGRPHGPSTYRPSNLGPNRYPQVETPDRINHVFNSSLTGYEGSQMATSDKVLETPDRIYHLFNTSPTEYQGSPMATPGKVLETPDRINHLFNESLTGYEDVGMTTPKNGKRLPSSVTRSCRDAQFAASTSDEAVRSTDTNMEDDESLLSSPFNPTFTSTPLHVINRPRQIPDSPPPVSEHDDLVDEEEELAAEYDRFPPDREEAAKAALASVEPYTFAAAEVAKYNNQTVNPECSSCTERVGQEMLPMSAVADMLSTYQKALLPLRDLDGDCYDEHVMKFNNVREKLNSSRETNKELNKGSAALRSENAALRSENHALRNENHHFDDKYVKLREELRRQYANKYVQEAHDRCAKVEAKNARLTAKAEQDKATIQRLQERIQQLEGQDMAASNFAADNIHLNDQNHSLSPEIADPPNPFTNNRASIRDKRVSSRPSSNKSSAVSKLGSQPMTIDHRFDDSDDTSSESENITTLAKEDITAMDTSEAPPSPEASRTPAAPPPSFLSRVQAGVSAVIKSPMKIFSGSPAKQASPLASKSRAPINKLDLKTFLKPNKSMRPQTYPRTPTKSTQNLGPDHHNTSRSVRFDAATARDDSEESEQPVTAQTPATVPLPVWSIYLHRRTRSTFYTKWTALQNQQKARLINGAQETHGEREYREHLEALKVLVNQAEAHLEDRRAKINAGIATPSATSSKKRNAETMTTTEGSPMKKQRFAFEQTRITTPPGFGQPIPGEDGYHTSTQPTWMSGSLTPSREVETLSSSQVFGAGASVPGASLGSSANSQALEPVRQRSPGRTFEVPSDDEDDMADPQDASASKDDSVVSQAVGKTFALNYDEFSESEDESMDDSMDDSDAWKGKPFSEWTKSTMTAFKEAPLPTGTAPAEQSLLNAVTSILAGHCPDPIHALVKSSDHPRITELGMTPDDFLTVSYPDDRGAVTYTRQSYYHWEVKPPGTEHMTNQERAAWKCMEEFKNWRKFSEVVRLYNEDDTPSLVAQIDGRLQAVQKKRKRVEDQEQEILRKEQELERRKIRMAENQKELDRIRDEQLQKQKEVAAMPKPPAPKQGFLNSMMTELEEQAQQAGPTVQQAAARVTVPSNTVRPPGQATLSSVISPQNPPPFIYDASGNVVLTTQPGAAPSTTASSPAWTQSPPPAPTPAHAQLPPQAKTAPASAPAVQPSNKYAPKKPSRLRESTTYSPGPNVQQSIEKNEDWRLMIPEPQQTGSLFGPGRLATPPDEKGYSQASVDAGVKALEELLPSMRRQPGWYGGPQNLPPV